MTISRKLIGLTKGASPTVSYNTLYSGTGPSGTSVTYPSINIGDAAPDRIVVLGIYLATGGVSNSISTVTIAGISATIIETTGPQSGRTMAVVYAAIPTGSSASVTITASSFTFPNYIYIASYSVYGANQYGYFDSSISSLGNNVDSLVSLTVNTPPQSVVLGFYGVAAVATSGDQAIWTGLNSDFSTNRSPTDTVVISGASVEGTTGVDLTATVRVTDTVVNRPSLVISSWR